jgi:hypothetical protein
MVEKHQDIEDNRYKNGTLAYKILKTRLVKIRDCIDETKKIRKMDSKSRSTIKRIAIETEKNLISASDLRPPPIDLPKRSRTPGNSEYRRIKLIPR